MSRTGGFGMVALMGLACLAYVAAAFGQSGQRQQIGSITARALRSTVTLGGREQTTIELTGGVSIQTDTGDILGAQRVTVVVGAMPDPARPGVSRTDVRTATASGDVTLKHVAVVRAGTDQAFRRVVNATASRAEMNRVTSIVSLFGDVRIRAVDTLIVGGREVSSYDIGDVSAAKVNLETGLITADANAGSTMRFATRQLVTTAGGAAYWRDVNGAARHAEINRASNAAVLTGDVNVTADEPAATYAWRNAARATVDFTAQKVDAEAAGGQQVNVDIRFKQPPAGARR